MDFFIDIVMEFVLEIFVEGYVAVTMALLPKKRFGPKAYMAIKIVCVTVSVICVMGLIIGVIGMTSTDIQDKIIGRYIFFIALAVTVIQVAIGIIGKIKSKAK